MSTVTFDTLGIAKDLQGKGFSPDQAEAVVRAVEAGRSIDLSDLATKQDLEGLRAATKQDQQLLRQDLEACASRRRKVSKSSSHDLASLRAVTKQDSTLLRQDMDLLRRDLTIRTGEMVFAASGLVMTVLGGAIGWAATAILRTVGTK